MIFEQRRNFVDVVDVLVIELLRPNSIGHQLVWRWLTAIANQVIIYLTGRNTKNSDVSRRNNWEYKWIVQECVCVVYVNHSASIEIWLYPNDKYRKYSSELDWLDCRCCCCRSKTRVFSVGLESCMGGQNLMWNGHNQTNMMLIGLEVNLK